jgi:hypothetical protein
MNRQEALELVNRYIDSGISEYEYELHEQLYPNCSIALKCKDNIKFLNEVKDYVKENLK